MRIMMLAALLAPSVALAVPLEFQHQGRMFDALGAPLTSTHDLTFTIYDDPAGTTSLWTETVTGVSFDDGYFAVAVGGGTPLDSATFDGTTRYLGVAIDTGPELSPRLGLVSVPYAIRAGSATDATNVTGGTVNASEVQIGGTTVIDSSGNVDYGSLVNTPPAVSYLAGNGLSLDGSTNTFSLDDAAVVTLVTDNAYDSESELTADLDDNYRNEGDTVDWSDLANVPADIADGDDTEPTAAYRGNWDFEQGPDGQIGSALPGWKVTGNLSAKRHNAGVGFDGTLGFGSNNCCSPQPQGAWSLTKYFSGDLRGLDITVEVKAGNAGGTATSCSSGEEFVGEDDARIWLYFYDANGTLLRTDYSDRASLELASGAGDLGGGWTQLSTTVTAPGLATTVRVELFADDRNNTCQTAGHRGTANAAIAFDDFSFSTADDSRWVEVIQGPVLPASIP